MKLLIKIKLGASLLLVSSLVLASEAGLLFEVNGTPFVIKRECLSDMTLNKESYAGKDYFSLDMRLKHSHQCAIKLNKLILNHVGGRLKTYYHADLISDVRLASSLNTQDGIRLSLDSEKLGNDILAFYRNKNSD